MQENIFRPQQFGKYMLTERIGAGGMAEIFRATAFGVEGFTKEICIKRILPTLTSDETFVKMFIDEAKIAVSLHHANVVQVFDLGRIGEHYFIAMELVQGRDLLRIINQCRRNKRRLPVHIALYILSQVCKGLDYAHRVKSEGRKMGIIHRDVSPSNILVSWEGEVKVADFGIAKATHREHKTVTGTMKGKYGYMSPEQVRGDRIDHRSDIFAAGILLYESLVSQRLFKGPTDLQTLEMVREAKVPVLPSAINKKVPPEVDELVMKALSLHPEDRFQTAGEMHDALADRLFETGKRVDSKALSEFMKPLFEEEIEKEEARAKERKKLTPPPSITTNDLTPPLVLPNPSTRPDIPMGATPLPRQRRSALFVAVTGTSIILAIAAIIVTVVWFSYTPPPPKPIAITSAPGVLFVDSQPHGASIVIDGNDTGHKTPATIEGLDRDTEHVLALLVDEYKNWSKKINFGQMQRVEIQAQLVPIPKPVPQKPAENKQDQKAKPRHKPKPQKMFGTLNVNTEGAWAYVYVDGKRQSRPTPLYGIRLRPGVHKIKLQNPKLGITKIRNITIRKNKASNLVVKLR